jgi:hypothetical protein
MSTTIVAGAKGGQGTTTVAASLAVTAARCNRRVVLIDTGGDAASILDHPPTTPADDLSSGIAEASPIDGVELVHLPADRIDADTVRTVSELATNSTAVIVDAGVDPAVVRQFDAVRPRPQRLLVVRPCYLAIRRAAAVPYTPDHIVLVRERLRSLTTDDVERALSLPVTTVDHDPVIARAIDAGLLVTHAHRHLGKPLRQLV